MAHEWKIRSMDEADSREAVRAAERHNVTTAVWLGQAIRAYVAAERGNDVPARDINSHSDPDQHTLIAMAALDLPQWLRRRVHRLLGQTLGVEPPKPPIRQLRLAAQSETVASCQGLESRDVRNNA